MSFRISSVRLDLDMGKFVAAIKNDPKAGPLIQSVGEEVADRANQNLAGPGEGPLRSLAAVRAEFKDVQEKSIRKGPTRGQTVPVGLVVLNSDAAVGTEQRTAFLRRAREEVAARYPWVRVSHKGDAG